MSFPGTKQEAIQYGRESTLVIDGETSTSPVRDGGKEAGGAPMGGTAEFTQSRSRTGIHDTQKSLRREYK